MARVSAIDGEGASGRSPLRLVKVRLSLALVAMAIMPLAIAAPLAYSVLDGQLYADRLRAERDSTTLATTIAAQLDRTTQAISRAAGSQALTGFLAVPARTNMATARAVLLTIGTPTDDGVRDVIVQDLQGEVRIWTSGGKVASGVPQLPANDEVLATALLFNGSGAWASPVHPNAAGAPTVTLAAPIARVDGDPPGGILRVDLSLSEILAASAADLMGSVTLARLVDGSGLVISEARGGGGAGVTDGTIASASIPGLSNWRVQLTEPRQSPETPLMLFGGLGVVVLAIGSLIVWMARQIIRPAEELEASRGRLHTMYEAARLDALSDALTGLGNHRAFHEEFDRQIESARRYSIPLALVLIDLDDFKLANDTSGHAAGDELLAEMGRLTLSTIRLADRAFRIGGDEFAVLMPHTDEEGARVVSRRLLATALETRPGTSVPNSFSFSIGISAFPNLAGSRRALYTQADTALYWSKTHGRTMIQVFDPARHSTSGAHQTEVELSASVAELIARRAIRAVYQPIVELRTGRIIGYEGLVRPTLDSGFANAGELFAAAEASGRQTELDQTCLEVVIAGAAALAPHTILSLNLSPRTLESPEFSVARMVQLLERYGIGPNRVIIELTERESVDEVDRLRHNVDAVHAAGLRIAADDVGAGNAGLRLLSQVQFDIVKVDLSLVQDGPQQGTSLAVLKSLQELAHRWGAWVIAEGIETPEHLELVRELGITAAQGYLLGRPGDSLDLATVDLGALLTRDDWLHKLARAPHPMAVGTGRGT